MSGRRWAVAAIVALAGAVVTSGALAGTGTGTGMGTGGAPADPVIPARLSLDDAVKIFRAHGLDLLIADAAVRSAEADVLSASAVANPGVSIGAGPAFNYDAKAAGCSGCQPYAIQWQITDNGAVSDWLSGKRGLRAEAAKAALASARLSRVDAERSLLGTLKQLYVQVAVAQRALDFAQKTDASLSSTAKVAEQRFPGSLDKGTLARIQVQALEAQQASTAAKMNLRQAQVALAFVLGVRGTTPDFTVDDGALALRVPGTLDGATEATLLRKAMATRPDLLALEQQRARAESSLALAKRSQVPDFSLFVAYSQLGTGQNVGQPMNAVFGVQTTLPVFYQQQGEIRRARADLDTQSLALEKARTQVASDVSTAWAAYVSSKEALERMETKILPRAKDALDIVRQQFELGQAPLMDFLDAERTWIAANVEEEQDLGAYWSAVYQLEQAVGMELR
jgi:cobalt-zinc-cadmium efflux system outer membrane protein